MRWRGEGKREQQLLSFSVLHVLFAPSVPYDNSELQHASVSLGGCAVHCSTAWCFGHWPRWRSCYGLSPYIPPPSQNCRGVCFMFSVEFLNVILVSKNKHLFVWPEEYLNVSHSHFSRGHQCFHRHLLTVVCCLLNSLSVHKEEGKQDFSHFCDIPLLTLSLLFLQPCTEKGTWDFRGLVKPSTY